MCCGFSWIFLNMIWYDWLRLIVWLLRLCCVMCSLVWLSVRSVMIIIWVRCCGLKCWFVNVNLCWFVVVVLLDR